MSGVLEFIIVLAIVVVVFGVGRLPAVGGAIGRMVRNFKNASSDSDKIKVARDESDRRLTDNERDRQG